MQPLPEMEIRLRGNVDTPIYGQIVEQVKQHVAANRLRPGDHLPTVRQLSHSLGISPGTVVRAYMQLEQEGIVQMRRGGGTVVSPRTAGDWAAAGRRTSLSDMISSQVLNALSLGYSPEEIEATFSFHLARWREERRHTATPTDTGYRAMDTSTIVVVASHDLALSMLVGLLSEKNPELNVDLTYAGSLGGLIALQEERAHLAGIHLLDEETGEYNYPYVKHVLPGRDVAIVHLAYRIQGLMVAPGNPKRIQQVEDLRRPDIVIVNRQRGSGTRVLLDYKLRQAGISPPGVRGYQSEKDTHLEVAAAVASGEADVGLGIEAAARASGLDFVPLYRERYDLVIPMANYRSKLLSPLLDAVASDEFIGMVRSAGGYDASQTGATSFLRLNR
ncbi:MAG: hypothetical protein DRI39_03970 [Chloroflexi bacterium]|nr:MAG: hypothetical protein DRI39_03970 [Chloroflexota bacterium]